ncbi:MAG: ribosomal RNA small subunit methyltransferase A [Candidatus Yonathbacteria bacterium]|nr:ribosomal RNA small subunit methyltransferase A [Candidatus Yonathbacteria bacterium]
MRAKKSLGQNFLNSKTVARDIVRASEILPADTILEIGPGKGFLSEEILKAGAKVVAVEKDDRMIPLLSEKFSDEIARGQFTLVHEDITEGTQGLSLGSSYKLIANIPYYLTGYILRTFLEMQKKPERMVLMLQKEVADRIVARDGKESILSLAVKAYGAPRIVKKVPARYFTPAPKVDSAVVSIENISDKHFKNDAEEQRFFEIVKTGFAHKRKQLAGNLKELFGKETLAILSQAGIAPNARAEDITLADWLALLEFTKARP